MVGLEEVLQFGWEVLEIPCAFLLAFSLYVLPSEDTPLNPI